MFSKRLTGKREGLTSAESQRHRGRGGGQGIGPGTAQQAGWGHNFTVVPGLESEVSSFIQHCLTYRVTSKGQAWCQVLARTLNEAGHRKSAFVVGRSGHRALRAGEANARP